MTADNLVFDDLAPRAFLAPLLWLLLPGVWAWGHYLATRISRSASVSLLLSPALGTATWVLSIHLIGKLSQSFAVGLWAGSIFVSALGVAGMVLRRRTESRRAPEEVGLNWKAMLLAAVCATALIAPMTLQFAFHDEALLTGHMSITAQLQNGHYPPRHLTFPEFELRYHYAFEVLAAIVWTLSGLRVDRCLDVVTLLLFFYTFCLLWLVGFRLVGPGRAALTPFVGLFGAGLMFLGMPGDAPWVGRFLALGSVNGEPYNPPALSYFFQHPWAAGLPWALSVLVLLAERNPRNLWRYSTLALLLAALSLGQVVLFVTFAGAFLVAESWSRGSLDSRRAGFAIATVVVALLTARLLGGFFLPPIDEGASFGLRAGAGPTPLVVLVWHLINFGALLPLGIAGLKWIEKGRVFFIVLALGSLAVFNFLYYEHSWDIVKFANVTALALAIPASAAVARLLRLRRKLVGQLLASVALVLLLVGGVSFAAMFALFPGSVPELYPRTLSPPEGDDSRAITWLRRRVQPGEIVYRRVQASLPYGQWGGLALPYYDENVLGFGFSKSRLDRRYSVLRTLPEEAEPYVAQGIRWLVLDPEDRALAGHADAWIASGSAREVIRIGELRLVRLTAGRHG